MLADEIYLGSRTVGHSVTSLTLTTALIRRFFLASCSDALPLLARAGGSLRQRLVLGFRAEPHDEDADGVDRR
jgi:hypothetical protein